MCSIECHASQRICKFLLGRSECQKIKKHLPQVLLFFRRVRKQFFSLSKKSSTLQSSTTHFIFLPVSVHFSRRSLHNRGLSYQIYTVNSPVCIYSLGSRLLHTSYISSFTCLKLSSTSSSQSIHVFLLHSFIYSFTHSFKK